MAEVVEVHTTMEQVELVELGVVELAVVLLHI